jgi:hypothetical protein
LSFGIRDAELILDQLPDATACSDRVGITELRRSFFEEAFELGKLLGIKFRWATGTRLGCKEFDALLIDDSSLTLNRGKATTENVDDFLIVIILFDQPTALNSAILQIGQLGLFGI